MLVTVRRNFATPAFTPASLNIEVTIAEDKEVGVGIAELSGTDADLHSPANDMNFRFTSTSPGQDYFQINRENGIISVKKGLNADPQRRSLFLVCYIYVLKMKYIYYIMPMNYLSLS